MANERLSKIQKWILETCFKITVLHNRKGLKPLKICCYYDKDKCPEFAVKMRNCYNNIICKCEKEGRPYYASDYCNMYEMYLEDILLNYFGMEFSYEKGTIHRVARIKMAHNTNKNYATVTRTMKNLEEKDLAFRYKYGEKSTEICLTDKGRMKAMELLHITEDEISEPPLLSDNECNEKKIELDAEIKRIESGIS